MQSCHSLSESDTLSGEQSQVEHLSLAELSSPLIRKRPAYDFSSSPAPKRQRVEGTFNSHPVTMSLTELSSTYDANFLNGSHYDVSIATLCVSAPERMQDRPELSTEFGEEERGFHDSNGNDDAYASPPFLPHGTLDNHSQSSDRFCDSLSDIDSVGSDYSNLDGNDIDKSASFDNDFDRSTCHFNEPIFVLNHPVFSTKQVIASPCTVRDFACACSQLKARYNLPWTAVDAICDLFKTVIPERMPGHNDNWHTHVPKNSNAVDAVIQSIKKAVRHSDGQIYALCPKLDCTSGAILVSGNPARIRQCSVCGAELFRDGHVSLPRKRLVFYPIRDFLESFRKDETLWNSHSQFMSVDVPEHLHLSPDAPDAVLKDFWNGTLAQDLVRENKVRVQPGEILLNLCPDGVTPGKRSSFSYWIFASSNLSLPPTLRHLERNKVVHAVVEGSVTKTSMKVVTDIIISDLMSSVSTTGDRAILAVACADHQSIRKLVCTCGANAEFGCEYCKIPGKHAATSGGGTSSNFYYPIDCYLGDESHVRDDSAVRSLRNELAIVQADIADVEKNIELHRSGRYFGNIDIAQEKRIRAEYDRNVKTIYERLRQTGYYEFSPLLRVRSMDIIRSKGEDLMHLLFENVGKEILSALHGEFKPVMSIVDDVEQAPKLLTDADLTHLSERVRSAIIPSSIERPPPMHLKNWRAIDHQTFFLFFAPSVLYVSNLSQDFYDVVLLFHMGARLISAKSVSKKSLTVAKACFLRFYLLWSSMTDRVKLSIHRLIHLVDKTFELGPLSNFWLYSFERLFGSSARSIVGSNEKFAQLTGNMSLAKLLAKISAQNLCTISDAAGNTQSWLDIPSAVRSVTSCAHSQRLAKSAHNSSGFRVRVGRFFACRARSATTLEREQMFANGGDLSGDDTENELPVLEVDCLAHQHDDWRVTSALCRKKHRENSANDGYVGFVDNSGHPKFGVVNRIILAPVVGQGLVPFIFASQLSVVNRAEQFRELTLQHVVIVPQTDSDVDEVCIPARDIVGNVVMHPVPHQNGTYFACITATSSVAIEKFVLDATLNSRDWSRMGKLYALLEEQL
jgi:hypothetical protein